MEEFMCGDIWTYLHDTETRVYRYWVYKKMFTPLEQDQKYIDQPQFEDSHCQFGIIRECVVLPDNELLIGFECVPEDGDWDDWPSSIEYYRLSEIHMSYFPADDKLLHNYPI